MNIVENGKIDKEKFKEVIETLIADKKVDSIEFINSSRALFLEKFAPEKIKNLDGDMLLNNIFLNIDSRDNLHYWLEFKNDDIFNKSNYGGIAGGTSFKYILFQKSDGRWVTGSAQNQRIITVEEAILVGREIRDALVMGAKEIENILGENPGIEEYKRLGTVLEEKMPYNMGKLGWVHKYFHLVYPEYFYDFHNVNWQKHILMIFGSKQEDKESLYIGSGQYREYVKELEYPAIYISSAIFKIYGGPVNYFRVSAGNDENSQWENMKKESYIGIGCNELGDLSLLDGDDKKEFKTKIANKLIEIEDYDKTTASRKAGEIIRFYVDVKKGDIIVAIVEERVLGIAKVVGEYEYKADRAYGHCKEVKWLRIFNDEEVKLPIAKAGLRTICYPYKDIENLLEIRNLIDVSIKENNERKITNSFEEIILNPLEGLAAEVESILIRKKQVILYGPPGTGKTYNAELICNELAARKAFKKSFHNLNEVEKEIIIGGVKNGLVRSCCFHPAYGYEDFIEGIKAKVINNQTVFENRDGIFKDICEEAKKDPEKNYYLIIDEINRGDIARIFGELIMLIENGKRGKNIILPLSNSRFSVPENLYIIGTMNTADRSISLLDVALRRRFGFKELMTDYSLFSDKSFEGVPLAGWLESLNERICENLGRDARNLQIGHSYFLEKGKVINSLEKFKAIVKEDVIPLIEEYCYGDYDLISKILGKSIVDQKKQRIKFELFDEGRSLDFIGALLELSPTIRIDKEDESEDIENQQDSEVL